MTALQVTGWVSVIAAWAFLARLIVPLVWSGDLDLDPREDDP